MHSMRFCEVKESIDIAMIATLTGHWALSHANKFKCSN
jgi:hypothetical protein